MNSLRRNEQLFSRLPLALLGALAGVTVFLLLYGTATLHPAWDAWVLNGYDETDVQQHYAGWVLFRNSHWAFPLGLADTIAVPDGTAISYTDSLPWVSILFKALRGVLPSTFQWFGWYTLLCFALQGAAGALLTARRATGRQAVLLACLGGALFACLPTLWERAFRHVALASHYLYLFALYFYLQYRAGLRAGKKGFPWVFALLGFAAVGIHPYYLPPVMLCALLAMLDCGRLTGQWGRGALQFGVSLGASALGGVLCGALGTGTAVSRDGYGSFSMNLNALFNPSSRGGYTWSRLLPVQAQQPGQYDGFNYLGLGVLALLAFALAYRLLAVLCRPAARGAAHAWWGRNWPLLAACAFLTLFAASNKIYFGNAGGELPLPQALLQLCGIFRSSGRMFYLAGACLVLFGIDTLQDGCAMLARGAKPLAVLALAAVLAVQVWDLSAVAAQKKAVFAAEINATVANDAQTAELGAGHTRLLATSPVREDRLRLLAILAGKQGLATNLDIAVSGSHPGAQGAMEAAYTQLQSGQYDAATVYVTTDGGEYEQWQSLFAGDAGVRLFVADSCYFLAPV